MVETVTTTAIMLIIGSASSFAWFLTWERIPQIATEYVLSLVSGPPIRIRFPVQSKSDKEGMD